MRVDVPEGRFDLNGVSWRFAFPMPADHWKAEYFANRDLAGAPVVLVDEGTGFIDHSWGAGGPAGLPTDNFSARFTRTVTFAASRYRFTLTSDDGGRLWVDEQLVIDGWGDAPLVPHVVEVLLSAGPHTLRYEYFDAVSGATARLTWEVRTAAILASGEMLGENQARTSLDGRYTLRYQGDGNLVVTREDTTCAWSSQTNGTSVGVAVMQPDGNFVVYNAAWTAVWSAGTHGHDGAWLEIANDELVVVTPEGTRFVIASLLALEPDAAAHPATGALAAGLVFASTGSLGDPPAPRAAAVEAVSPLALAVAVLCGLIVWRVRRRQGGRWTPCGPQAASRQPRAGWRVRHRQGGRLTPCRPQAANRQPRAGCRVGDRLRRRLPATALLLTALLLVPANALAQTTTQLVEYYHTDVLGSVRAVTKQVNGQWQVTRHDFMPFGEEVSPQNPPVDKRLFTGKERDAETGLDYFGARYYRADVGRFTTVDLEQKIKEALVDPQKWNRYVYVRNNPLRYVDPDGRWGMDVHFYLTYFLAGASGYSSDSAYRIAAADVGVDIKHDPFRISVDERRKWHFPDLARQVEIGDTLLDYPDESTFGEALHVFQDSSSHGRFAPSKGHAAESLLGLANPDSTSKNIDNAMTMARDTYYYMTENIGQTRKALPWSAIEPYVRRYLDAGTDKEKQRRFYEMRQFLARDQQ